jgi:uroporphyrinogen decarboxylase
VNEPSRYVKYLGLKDTEELFEYFGFDLRYIFPAYAGTRPNTHHFSIFGPVGGGDTFSSQYGIRPFANVETVKEIDAYPWPDINEWEFDSLHETLDGIWDKYAVMAGAWAPIFCQVLDFFGMEEAMINLHWNPKVIEATIAHIEDFYLKYYDRFFNSVKGKAVFFNMGDDFATQRGMLIDPNQWRKYFKPVYRKLFGLAKKYGLYVWFHCCGAISDVLPDLIDIGMDVWETVQVHLPGNEPERIKREFGKEITFFGAVNTQSTLPYGTPEDVRREVRERIKVLGKGGGYICGPDHHIKVDVPWKIMSQPAGTLKAYGFYYLFPGG